MYIVGVEVIVVTSIDVTPLNNFLLDVFFEKSMLDYIVFLYFPCLQNIKLMRDQWLIYNLFKFQVCCTLKYTKHEFMD